MIDLNNNKSQIAYPVWNDIKKHISKEAMLKFGENIQKVLLGYKKPISRLHMNEETKRVNKISTNEEAILFLIKKALKRIGADYIGLKEVRNESIDTCCSFVRSHYSHLGIPELIHAFDLAIIKVIDANVISYGNEFNVVLVGRVLQAYNGYRAKIMVIIREAMSANLNSDHTDEKEKKEKNIIARKIMAVNLQNCYERFWRKEIFKIDVGLNQFLSKLGYEISKTDEKKENEYLEKRKKRISISKGNKSKAETTDISNDKTMKIFFDQMKKSKITPKDFGKDIQSRLLQHEKQIY